MGEAPPYTGPRTPDGRVGLSLWQIQYDQMLNEMKMSGTLDPADVTLSLEYLSSLGWVFSFEVMVIPYNYQALYFASCFFNILPEIHSNLV